VLNASGSNDIFAVEEAKRTVKSSQQEMALHTDISAMEAQHLWPAPLSKKPKQRPRLKRSWPASQILPSRPQAMMP
jgi:hypothetical protein